MSDLVLAVMGGLISGVFSAGVVVGTLRRVTKSADDAHTRIDKHIEDHATGKFNHVQAQ